MKHWIQTFTGRALDLDDPQPDQIVLEDIAHGLAMNARWAGQSLRRYSVAEHSCHVALLTSQMLASRVNPRPFILGALFHDAHEAYTGDITGPMKQMIGEPIRLVQRKLQWAIEARFEIPPEPELVKLADLQCRALERDQILGPCERGWGEDLPRPALQIRLECLDVADAEAYWLGWARDWLAVRDG